MDNLKFANFENFGVEMYTSSRTLGLRSKEIYQRTIVIFRVWKALSTCFPENLSWSSLGDYFGGSFRVTLVVALAVFDPKFWEFLLSPEVMIGCKQTRPSPNEQTGEPFTT